MSIVGVTNVVVQRNPAALSDPFELEVSFECLEDLQEDLEWKLVYVGDPEDKTKDQVLYKFNQCFPETRLNLRVVVGRS